MACEQPSQSLVKDEVRDPGRPLGQAGDAEAADAEEVVEADAGEDLFRKNGQQSRSVLDYQVPPMEREP